MRSFRLAFLALACAGSVQAETLRARPVADLNTRGVGAGSHPSEFAQLSGAVVFVATDEIGPGLWRTDGTESGTVRLPDSCVAGCAGPSRLLWVEADRAFYSDHQGLGLWVSGGTAASTRVLSESLRVSEVRVGDGHGGVYFVARDAETGEEPWFTDATPEGTRRVIDLRPGPSGSAPSDLTFWNGALFFVALEGPGGPAIWRAEPTGGVTVVLRGEDSDPGHTPRILGATPSGLVLRTWTPDRGFELAITGGTPATTRDLPQLAPGPESPAWYWWRGAAGRVVLGVQVPGQGDEIYSVDEAGSLRRLTNFQAAGALSRLPDGLRSWFDMPSGHLLVHVQGARTALWSTDGTPPGTKPLGNLQVQYWLFASTGDALFAIGQEPQHGEELWQLTPGGARRVTDLCPGRCSSGISSLAVLGGEAIFTDLNSIWITRGGGARAVRLAREREAYLGGVVAGRAVGVSWRERTGSEPWTLGLDRTFSVLDLNPGTSGGDSNPSGFAALREKALFVATRDSTPALWRSDGTARGTIPVAGDPISPSASGVFGSANNFSGTFLVLGRTPYLLDPGEGSLFFVDGASARSHRLTGSTVQVVRGAPRLLGGRAIFGACEPAHGCEPWISDGTAAGTHLLVDLVPGPVGSGFLPLLTRDGEVLAHALVPGTGTLWRTDGTAGGTRPAIASSSLAFPRIAIRGAWTYFVKPGVAGSTSCSIPELWRVGALPASEERVRSLDSAPCTVDEVQIADVGARLLVSLGGSTGGQRERALYLSDATPEGTVHVTTVGTDGAVPLGPVRVGQRFYFTVGSQASAGALWSTDGTPAGTRAHPEWLAGPTVYQLAAFGDQLVVFATTEATESGIWITDGSVASTRRLASGGWLGPSVAGKMFFAGLDEHGFEPWVIEDLP